MTFTEWLAKARPHFPAIDEANSRPTSPADDAYNCIAWAAGDSERWWWPDLQEQKYWPPNVPRAETIDAFVKAFEQLGYSTSTDASLQPDMHKIAIFATSNQLPTHAARQLPDGRWTSKLGPQIDIEHELSAVQGPVYGAVAVVLGRVAASASEC